MEGCRPLSSKDPGGLGERRPSHHDGSSRSSTSAKMESMQSGLLNQMPTISNPFVRLVPATSSDPIPNIVIPSHLFTTLVNIAAAGVLQALSSGLVPGVHMDQLGADQPGVDHEMDHVSVNHRDVELHEMSDSETSHSELNHSEMERTSVIRSDGEKTKPERLDGERSEMVKQEISLSDMDMSSFMRMRNQFVCAACGIRFKSLDNLQAHQTYYCTKRAGGPLIPIAPNANSSDGGLKMSHEENAVDVSRAKRTNGTPAEKSVNGCNGNGNVKSRSSSNQQQVQSFQCSICGYKGHTLRGMRTHVRMHTDELHGANEEDFIDHLDHSVPVPVVLSNGNAPKKRTSSGVKRRKSNDHHDDPQQVTTTTNYLLNHDDHQLTNTAPSCPGFSSKSSPMETHSESEESVTHEPAPHFNCFHCNYKSNYYGDIVKHMKLVHKDSPFNTIFSQPMRQSSVELHESDHSSDDVGVGKSAGSKSPVVVDSKRRRKEKTEPKVPVRPSSESALPLIKRSPEPPSSLLDIVKGMKQQNGTARSVVKEPESSVKNSLKYCEDCDISFNFVNSYLAHKQFYCSANK